MFLQQHTLVNFWCVSIQTGFYPAEYVYFLYGEAYSSFSKKLLIIVVKILGIHRKACC